MGTITSTPDDLLTSDKEGVRRYKVESTTSTVSGGSSAFGESVVSGLTPAAQITAQYGINNKVLTAAINGTTTASDSLYNASVSATVGAVSAILSQRQVSYRAGQGLRGIISTVFDTPVVGTSQQGGLFNSEVSFSFGYKDDKFGIVRAYGGKSEIQELTISTGATSSGDLTVTVDGLPLSIPVTTGSTELNAYEIATYIDRNDPRYNASSNGSVVTLVGNLPELGGGSFSLTPSLGVTGSFFEVQGNQVANEEWDYIEDWTERPNYNVDPTKGNVYMIQFANGFDNPSFYIKNPDTNNFDLVHIIKYGNKNTDTIVKNPTFRIGWGCRNTTAANEVSVKGSSAAIFYEGIRTYDNDTESLSQLRTVSTSGNDVHVLSVRNRYEFNGIVNRATLLLLSLDVTTELTKVTTFKVIRNPVLATGDYLDFEYKDDANSIVECAKNDVVITGGDVLAEYDTLTSRSIDISRLVELMNTGDSITITASKPSGASDDVKASLIMRSDL